MEFLRAQHQVHVGQFFDQLLAAALGHATHETDDLVALFTARGADQVFHLVDGLLLGEIADAPQDVVIVPDEAMEGTNVLRLGPRALRRFPFSFGPLSYAAHCAAAHAAGFEVRTVSSFIKSIRTSLLSSTR